MKCHDAIRFISVYVDSELDPRTSFEIAEHLETCSSCAARFAREQELEKGLVAALNKGADEGDDQLWARVVQAVRSEPSRSARAAA
ncbi:zf-HC2 domain-containing protein, partial [bacterium]|nr:zf-HC2 domain-containing protein [bacterium]